MKKYQLTSNKESAMQEGAIHMTPTQEKAFKREGIRVVVGGILIHFVLGTFYLWGGISLYVASYLRSYDDTIDIDLVKMVFPFMNVAINVALSFGVKLAEKIGHKFVLLGGVILIALANLIVSFITNFVAFVLIYVIMIGISSGLMYMVPVICGWKYFPNKKGLVSGAIVAGYGFGSFTFNFIALAIVNPDNVVASIPHDGHKYFTEPVYSLVPKMFRYLALCYLIIGLIGFLLVKMPKAIPQEHHDEHDVLTKEGEKKMPAHEHHDCTSVTQGIKSRPFWILSALVVCGSFFGLLMANNYKVYGLENLKDDKFVTTVGSIGSAANGCSRLFWAWLFDKFGFKRVYFILMAIQTVLAGTLNLICEVKALYLIWYALIMGTEGGQFSMMPAVSGKVFGHKTGPLIYGIIFLGFAVANVASFLLTKFGLQSLGWPSIFWICFALSVTALALNILFKEDYEFS